MKLLRELLDELREAGYQIEEHSWDGSPYISKQTEELIRMYAEDGCKIIVNRNARFDKAKKRRCKKNIYRIAKTNSKSGYFPLRIIWAECAKK